MLIEQQFMNKCVCTYIQCLHSWNDFLIREMPEKQYLYLNDQNKKYLNWLSASFETNYFPFETILILHSI